MKTQENLIILAPMEGVLDALMRSLLTSINSYDMCITEFVRVVDRLVPKHVFYKICPELHNQGLTSNNTPIRIQLLGQHPNWMAENAARAIELGSKGIDLNFGCPAQTVNKSKGGAYLLKTPETIYRILSEVKSALDAETEVSAKIRLGFDDTGLLDEIVDAIVSANADLLTIHARTKRQGYKPPAYWQYIGKFCDKYDINIVANGEIWSKEDAENCQRVSQTSNLMLGRGALALPNLANVIKHNDRPMPWNDMCALLMKYSQLELKSSKSFYYSSRVKQWLRYLKLQYPQAEVLFQQIKRFDDKQSILDTIKELHLAA